MIIAHAGSDRIAPGAPARLMSVRGTVPALDSFQRSIRQHGIPLGIYADKHTTDQSPAEPRVDEQPAGTKPQSQFGRALGELRVELIAAHSPQAKGRVERRFQTLQDRLITELRVVGIATIEAANQFLKGSLPRSNRRCAVRLAQTADLHRPAPLARELARSLCSKTSRCLRKDFTIAYEGQFYQIHDTTRARPVQVEEQLDGELRITHHGQALGFHAVAERQGVSWDAHPRHLQMTSAEAHEAVRRSDCTMRWRGHFGARLVRRSW